MWAQVLRDPARIRGEGAALSPAGHAASCVAAYGRQASAALHDAMELVANIPLLGGSVAVCPDVSRSMSSPATGYRPGATSAVRCIDVAALVAAAVLRKNPDARILPLPSRCV